LIFLQKLGIRLSSDDNRAPHYDTANHQTNIPGIYLAGVICGGMDTHTLFIENSREHAEKIMQHIAAQETYKVLRKEASA
jgi:thioredoxin reductase (NADPH)